MEWLNETFAGFDGGVFRAMHSLAEAAGGFLTPFTKLVTFIGEKGIVYFLAAIVLMLFPKTRRAGVCVFGAVGLGAILTSLTLKGIVGRERPFLANETFRAFWEFVGSPHEDGYCFPSGHVTSVTAAATALFIFFNKKWSGAGFFAVLLMAFSRVYLIAHYATDTLAGMLVGALSCAVAWGITKGIFRLLGKYPENKFCAFCLTFDVRALFRRAPKTPENGENE